jgi:hypothetical protein
LFLLAKATFEIHDKLEGGGPSRTRSAASFASVIVQVMILDIVFSLDSVITAVGMANVLWVMVTAIVLAVLVMLLATEPISSSSKCIRRSRSGAVLPAAHRHLADRRRLGQHGQALHLLRDGLLGVRRDDQHQDSRKGPTAELHRPSAEE